MYTKLVQFYHSFQRTLYLTNSHSNPKEIEQLLGAIMGAIIPTSPSIRVFKSPPLRPSVQMNPAHPSS